MSGNFQKKRLKNGITVLHEARSLPLVSISITNKFGAICETEKIKGIAHVIEHLVFTGTKTRTHEDISREIEKKGGILNAFTSQDVTSFWFKLPSEHVFAGLDILTDILNNPVFEKKKFEKEKKVILEEIKMYHDSPQRHVNDKIEENLYSKPFGIGIAGTAKTVSSIQRDFALDFYKKNYNPRNYIVSVVGKVDFKKICEYLEKNFKANSFIPKIQKFSKINKNSVEERSGIDQAHLILATHAPKITDDEYYALELMDTYLAHGMSSQLFLEIREKRGLAYSVKSSISTEKNYSYYSIYVGTTKKAVNEVKSLIIQGFKDVEKMTEKDLREGKEMLIGLKRVYAEESSNVMNSLMFQELADKAENYYKYELNVSKVKLAEIKKLAPRLIEKYSTAAIVPKD